MNHNVARKKDKKLFSFSAKYPYVLTLAARIAATAATIFTIFVKLLNIFAFLCSVAIFSFFSFSCSAKMDKGLLADIQKGKKLKKTVTNDRSAPMIGCKYTERLLVHIGVYQLTGRC